MIVQYSINVKGTSNYYDYYNVSTSLIILVVGFDTPGACALHGFVFLGSFTRRTGGCALGCSDFDFFHILKYKHPSLTP
jgi:hypothetical protein